MLTRETIANHSMWVYHGVYGMQGCSNDINVVEATALSEEIASRTYSPP